MKILIVGILLGFTLVGGQVRLASAQAVQPTGQSNPETQNPQTQPAQNAQNLTAPTTFLQDSGGPQVLGASINQLSLSNTKLAVEQPANAAGEPASALDTPEQQLEASSPTVSRKLIIATGVLTLLLGFWAIYLAAKRKIT